MEHLRPSDYMARLTDGAFNVLPGRLQKSKIVQQLIAPIGRTLSPDRWIFVIGCYNSGTTLLKEILASHPKIGGLPAEGVALTDALPRPEECGWTRMWHACYEAMCVDEDDQELARRAQRHWSLLYPSRADNLVEKSIANATRIPFLQKQFQPTYFIYIVRDGYAVAEGIRRKARPGEWGNPEFDDRYPIELCARQWRRSDEVVSDARADTERFLSIKYEELTAAPSTVLEKITTFLDLPPLPKEVISKTWGVHGYDEPIRNMNPRSHRRLSDHEMNRIQSEAKNVMEKYSYKYPLKRG